MNEPLASAAGIWHSGGMRLPLLLALVAASASAIGPYSGSPVARAAKVEGWVELTDPVLRRAWDLPRHSPLIAGDRLALQRGGRVILALPSAGRVALSGPGRLEFLERGEEGERLRLLGGGLLAENRGERALSILTTDGDLELAPGARAWFYAGSGGAEAVVLEGAARRTPPRGAPVKDRVRRVSTGDWVRMATGETGAPPEGWRGDIEALEAQLAPRAPAKLDPRLRAWLRRVVPREYADDLADLSEHGEWREERGGGWSWRPNAPTGWAPYTLGQWRWTPGGLFWVSRDEWGWLPYRLGGWLPDEFGRWRWRPDDQFGGAHVLFFPIRGGWGWSPVLAATGDGAPPPVFVFPRGEFFAEGAIARPVPREPASSSPASAPAHVDAAPRRDIPLEPPAPGRPAAD